MRLAPLTANGHGVIDTLSGPGIAADGFFRSLSRILKDSPMKKCVIVCALWMAGGVWPATAAPPALAWKQTPTSLTLLSGEAIVWQFNYEKGEGKPFFHPVTVAGSPTLTDLRPVDHPWHLALWFSWKFINGVNYWEFDRKTGKTAGTTEVLDVNVAPGADHGARFQLKLAYHPPGQPPLLSEDRTIVVTPPTPAGQWHIDWQSTFTAGADDVRLDRTPIVGEPQGKPHGGYAGLSFVWRRRCATGASPGPKDR